MTDKDRGKNPFDFSSNPFDKPLGGGDKPTSLFSSPLTILKKPDEIKDPKPDAAGDKPKSLFGQSLFQGGLGLGSSTAKDPDPFTMPPPDMGSFSTFPPKLPEAMLQAHQASLKAGENSTDSLKKVQSDAQSILNNFVSGQDAPESQPEVPSILKNVSSISFGGGNPGVPSSFIPIGGLGQNHGLFSKDTLKLKDGSSNDQQPGTELLTARNSVYHAANSLAPLLDQHYNLSFDLRASFSKIFYNPDSKSRQRSLVCFLETTATDGKPANPSLEPKSKGKQPQPTTNLALLVNQTDHITNLLSHFHAKGKLMGNILDFTVRDFRYLYVLYGKSVAVLDIEDLLAKGHLDDEGSQVQLLGTIQLAAPIQKDQPSASKAQSIYTCIETAANGQSVVVFSHSLARRNRPEGEGEVACMVHIDCKKFVSGIADSTTGAHKQTFFQFGDQADSISGGIIMDYEIWDNYLAVLLKKNQVLVYNLALGRDAPSKKEAFYLPVYKTKFLDAQEIISQIFYMPPPAPATDQTHLAGSFILVETLNLWDPKLQSDPNMKEKKKQSLKKLHLVNIVDKVGPLPASDLPQNKQKSGQSLSPADQLQITEVTAKFVEFDRNQSILFLMNRKRGLQDRQIKFFSVRISRSVAPEAEELKFEFVTEVRLNMSNTSFSAIQKYKALSAPPVQFLSILNSRKAEGAGTLGNFFVYCGIHDQVMVFERPFSLVRPVSNLVKGLLESKEEEQQNSLVDNLVNSDEEEPLTQSSLMAKFKKYKEKAEQDTFEMTEEQNKAITLMYEERQKKMEEELKQEELQDQMTLDQNIANALNELGSDFRSEKDNDEEDGEATPSELSDSAPKAKKKKGKNKKSVSPPSPSNATKKATTKASEKKLQKAAKKQPAPPPLTAKQQQEHIVSSMQQLQEKYGEIAGKLNQLNQQIQRQQQLKFEIDASIQNAVKDGLNEKVQRHLKGVLVGEVTKKLKGVDEQINTTVMPKLEQSLASMMQKELANFASSDKGELTAPKVQAMIKKEFRTVMKDTIKPEIQACITEMLGSLDKKLLEIDDALCDKLEEEEDRYVKLLDYYENSIKWLQQFHAKVSNLAKTQISQQMKQFVDQQKEFQKQLQHEAQTKLISTVQSQVFSKIQDQINTHIQAQVSAHVGAHVQAQIQAQVQAQVQAQLAVMKPGSGGIKLSPPKQSPAPSVPIQSMKSQTSADRLTSFERQSIQNKIAELQSLLEGKQSSKPKPRTSGLKQYDQKQMEIADLEWSVTAQGNPNEHRLNHVMVHNRPVIMYDSQDEDILEKRIAQSEAMLDKPQGNIRPSEPMSSKLKVAESGASVMAQSSSTLNQLEGFDDIVQQSNDFPTFMKKLNSRHSLMMEYERKKIAEDDALVHEEDDFKPKHFQSESKNLGEDDEDEDVGNRFLNSRRVNYVPAASSMRPYDDNEAMEDLNYMNSKSKSKMPVAAQFGARQPRMREEEESTDSALLGMIHEPPPRRRLGEGRTRELKSWKQQ